MKVYSYTEPREAVLGYKDWLLSRNGRWQRVVLAEGKRHGKAVIARLEGIEDRDAAAELTGSDTAYAELKRQLDIAERHLKSGPPKTS